MPDGGKFTLSIDKEEGKVVFRMADTGPGIPEEIADKLAWWLSFIAETPKAAGRARADGRARRPSLHRPASSGRQA